MFIKSILPALLWALFILVICAIPGDRLPPPTFLEWLRPDKIVHVVVFGILGYFLMKGFTKQEIGISLKTNPGLWVFLFCTAYGALIEVLQEYIFIHRNGDVRDALTDAAGAALGVWFFNRLRKKRVSPPSSS